MRALGIGTLLWGLVACSGPEAGHLGGNATPSGTEGRPAEAPVSVSPPDTSKEAPFAGAWASCEGATSPDECSRYLLMQRGDRVCGTWSYVASGMAYEGRVIARAMSSTEARRTHICGRPGAETDTECSDGWQRVDKPLRRCGDDLGDLDSADGTCFADYRAVPLEQGEWEAFQAQAWVKDCLSKDP